MLQENYRTTYRKRGRKEVERGKLFKVSSEILPKREEPGSVEEGPQGPVHHLTMHRVGGRCQVTIPRGELEALVKRSCDPDTFEALGGQPLHIRVGIGALQVLVPAQMPPG